MLQEFKRKSSMEAELRTLRAIGPMEEKLRAACNAPDATFSSAIKVCYLFCSFGLSYLYAQSFPSTFHHFSNASPLQVLDGMVAEYDAQVSGPFKYQKLVQFLQKRYAVL